jgi:C-terminal processing protease CtpA/Prc
MSRSRPVFFAIILSALASSLRAQPAADSAMIRRLTAVGHLYGTVKWFHPAWPAKTQEWDAAVVKAVEQIAARAQGASYRAIIEDMLTSLDDAATRIVAAPTAFGRTDAATATKRWEVSSGDSTLVISIPSARFATDDWQAVAQQINTFRPDIRRGHPIVFDLRQAKGPGMMSFIFPNALLPTARVTMPAMRKRMCDGLQPPTGYGVGGFCGHYEERGPIINAVVGKARKIVFLVRPDSDVPDIAFAMRATGQADIIVQSADPTASLMASAAPHRLDMGEGISVDVRTGELSPAAPPNIIIDEVRDPMAVALAAARSPFTPPDAPSSPSPTTPEPTYPEMRFPSTGYRVLAAFRFWSAVDYYFPYKALLDKPWSSVLPLLIRDMLVARDSLEYAQAAARMVTHIQDSHGSVRGNAVFDAWFGTFPTALLLQYVEGKPVVVRIGEDSSTVRSGIRVGDVIVNVDGEDVDQRRDRLKPFLAHSSPQALDHAIAQRLLRGTTASPARLVVRRANTGDRVISTPRGNGFAQVVADERTGPIVRLLSPDIGYADLSRLTLPMVDTMFAEFRHTRAIIFDMRGYPNGTMFAIAARLSEKPVAVARITRTLVMSPDTALQTTRATMQYSPEPQGPRYTGRIVVLVDERAISQAEHTVLVLKEAGRGRVIIVGSASTGANGNVVSVSLPGGMDANFTGYEIRHADGRQLQRVGIVPDVHVRPTIAGVRSGRDEVLERAVELLKAGYAR